MPYKYKDLVYKGLKIMTEELVLYPEIQEGVFTFWCMGHQFRYHVAKKDGEWDYQPLFLDAHRKVNRQVRGKLIAFAIATVKDRLS